MRALWLGLGVALAPAVAAAHATHYNQSAYLTVRREGVELQIVLAPGTHVAATLLRTLDANHDGRLSSDERRRYATEVLADATLTLDGRPVTLALRGVDCPEEAALRSGESVIRVRAFAARPLSAGRHEVVYSTRHAPVVSVYDANAFAEGAGLTLSAPRRGSAHRRVAFFVDVLPSTVGGPR